jgi:hypothetical protein
MPYLKKEIHHQHDDQGRHAWKLEFLFIIAYFLMRRERVDCGWYISEGHVMNKVVERTKTTSRFNVKNTPWVLV